MSHLEFDIWPFKEYHNIFEFIQIGPSNQITVDRTGITINSQLIFAHEHHSSNTLVKVDVWIIGEYLVYQVERYRNICAVNRESFGYV